MKNSHARPLNVLGENTVLAGLPRSDRRRLTAGMQRIALNSRSLIYVLDRPLDYVYFPLTGVISVTVRLDGGLQTEIGTIGNEGMVGVALLHGTHCRLLRHRMQSAGTALRMAARDFVGEVGAHGSLSRCAGRYAQAWLNQVSQSTGCNSQHSVEQRMCRWLLVSHDRAGTDEFPLTEAVLGRMLSARRPRVVTAAGRLQRAGIISYSHGVIRIRDRSALARASCECYRLVRDEYIRLLC